MKTTFFIAAFFVVHSVDRAVSILDLANCQKGPELNQDPRVESSKCDIPQYLRRCRLTLPAPCVLPR